MAVSLVVDAGVSRAGRRGADRGRRRPQRAGGCTLVRPARAHRRGRIRLGHAAPAVLLCPPAGRQLARLSRDTAAVLGPGDLVLCSGTLPRHTPFADRVAAASGAGFTGLSMWGRDYAAARAEGHSDAD